MGVPHHPPYPLTSTELEPYTLSPTVLTEGNLSTQNHPYGLLEDLTTSDRCLSVSYPDESFISIPISSADNDAEAMAECASISDTTVRNKRGVSPVPWGSKPFTMAALDTAQLSTW